jgi:hypothetical protein
MNVILIVFCQYKHNNLNKSIIYHIIRPLLTKAYNNDIQL